MAIDPRKLQRKLERKRAKEKKRAVAERTNNDPLARFERAATAPVLHCCVHAGIHEQGMGILLFSRVLPNGSVAFAQFLIDKYCLGVKDLFFGVTKRPDYDWRVHAKFSATRKIVTVTPEYACKLVEGAVSYARGLGFAPPSDYEKARRIFGDVDPWACGDRIDFGHDGKPLYIAGPRDSQAKQEHIMSILLSRLGPGGYHYILPVSATSVAGYFDEESEDDEAKYLE